MASLLSRITCGLFFVAMGVGSIVLGVRREVFECDRGKDLCWISTDYRVHRSADRLRITDITNHAYVTRSKRRGQTELHDRSGGLRVVAAGLADDARPRYELIHAFLSGQGAHLEIVTGPWAAYTWVGVVFIVLSPLGFIRGWSRR